MSSRATPIRSLLHAALLVGCSSGAPTPSAPPIEVTAPAEPASTQASASPPPSVQPFADFAGEFLDGLGAKRNLDRYVDPELGVFLLANPGATHLVSHFADFSSLAAQERAFALSRFQNQCHGDAWFTSDQRVPHFSCETEKYDIDAACVRGELRSDAVSTLLRLNMQYEVIPVDEGEKLMPAAKRAESFVTHYVFLPPFDLGFYFGRVRGSWRVLWVNVIEPCSA